MMKSVVALLLVTIAAYAGNAPLISQFAQGYRLRTEGDSAIYHLLLPEEVYRKVSRPDLGDIRVFNTGGEIVPHVLLRTEQQHTEKTITHPVPFFPISVDMNDSGNTVKITTDINDSITSIVVQGGEKDAGNTGIKYYLIDLSAIKQEIDELQVNLAGTKSSYIKTTVVEYGNDLSSWKKIDTDTTLANMQYGQHHLIKDRIRLPGNSYKYLRFMLKDNSEGLTVNSVNALTNQVEYQWERQWSQVKGVTDKSTKTSMEFDTGGFYPVDRIELVWPDDNVLIQGALNTRGDTKSPWTRRYSGLFFKLKHAGTHLLSGPVDVQFTRDHYWLLSTGAPEGVGMEAPVLKFSWIPNQVYFLARGEPPFVLAFGNATIGPAGSPGATLLNIVNRKESNAVIGTAAIGEPVSLKGEDALTPERHIPWQRILLWGVLVIGVIVVGVMALRLIKQMNRS